MDRGLLLGIYGVISGWALILLSLAVIKVLITFLGTGLGDLLTAFIEVAIGFLALGTALYLWYRILRWTFLSFKSTGNHGGPGGT